MGGAGAGAMFRELRFQFLQEIAGRILHLSLLHVINCTLNGQAY